MPARRSGTGAPTLDAGAIIIRASAGPDMTVDGVWRRATAALRQSLRFRFAAIRFISRLCSGTNSIDDRLVGEDEIDELGPAPIPRVSLARPIVLTAGWQIAQERCPVPVGRHQMEITLQSTRCWDRGCDDLKAGAQVMVQFVRIDMFGHRVVDAIGQESCAKLAEDGWQIVVVVRPMERNIRAALDSGPLVCRGRSISQVWSRRQVAPAAQIGVVRTYAKRPTGLIRPDLQPPQSLIVRVTRRITLNSFVSEPN